MLPALFALLFKNYLLINCIAALNEKYSKIFIVLLAVFSLHSFLELNLFFKHLIATEYSIYAMQLYYIGVIAMCAVCVMYALEVAKFGGQSILRTCILAITLIVSLYTLSSDGVIAGAQPISYAVTRVQGNYYFIFQTVVIVSIIAVISILILGYLRNNDSALTQIQCAYVLFALMPMIVTGLLIMTLMQFGYKVNAMTVLPIASSAFLYIMFVGERNHKLTDIRRHIPNTAECVFSNEIYHVINGYMKGTSDYQSTIKGIEKMMINYKYTKAGYNATKTAKMMNIPRVTLYSKLKKLGL